MTKYTTTSLIEFLKKFPEDLPIGTDLALMWNYPKYLDENKDKMDYDEFKELTMKDAYNLCIFEGDWQKGRISDIECKLDEFFKGDCE